MRNSNTAAPHIHGILSHVDNLFGTAPNHAPIKIRTNLERFEALKLKRDTLEKNTTAIIPDPILMKIGERYPWASDESIYSALEKRLSSVFRVMHKLKEKGEETLKEGEVYEIHKDKTGQEIPTADIKRKVAGSNTLTLDHINHLIPKKNGAFKPPIPHPDSGVTHIDTSSFPRLHKTSGNTELKEFLKTQLVIPYKYPSLAEHKEPTVLILHGPPGGGKTYSVACMAEELQHQTGEPATVYLASGSQLRTKYHGESREFIERFLKTGNKLPKDAWRILFLDEATPGKEGDSDNAGAIREVNNSLKELLEGLKTKVTTNPHRTIIVFATNHIGAFEDGLLDRATVLQMSELSKKTKKKAARNIFKKMRLLLPDHETQEVLDKVSDGGLRQLKASILNLRNKTVQHIMEDDVYKPFHKRIAENLKKTFKRASQQNSTAPPNIQQKEKRKADQASLTDTETPSKKLRSRTVQIAAPQQSIIAPLKLSGRQKKNLQRRANKIKQQKFWTELASFDIQQEHPYTAIVRKYPNRYAHFPTNDARKQAASKDYIRALNEMESVQEKREEMLAKTKHPEKLTLKPDWSRRQQILDKAAAIPPRGKGSYNPTDPSHVEKRKMAFHRMTRSGIQVGITDRLRRAGKIPEGIEKSTKKNGRRWLPMPKEILENFKVGKKESNLRDEFSYYI